MDAAKAERLLRSAGFEEGWVRLAQLQLLATTVPNQYIDFQIVCDLAAVHAVRLIVCTHSQCPSHAHRILGEGERRSKVPTRYRSKFQVSHPLTVTHFVALIDISIFQKSARSRRLLHETQSLRVADEIETWCRSTASHAARANSSLSYMFAWCPV